MKKNELFMEKMMDSKSQNPNPNEIPSPKSQETPNGQQGGSRKPYDLRERTLEFAVRILSVAATLPKEHAGRMVADQISRSGSSIGANVEEADGAVSRLDKRRILIVARKEARETRYWLRLIDRVWGSKVAVKGDIGEATQLLNILSSIIDKLQ